MSGVVTNSRVLRLVNTDAAPVSRPHLVSAQAETLTTRLDALDARWVLAVRTTMSMEGGLAAILRPEARRSLTAMALKLGLRPFDAAMIIAIAQDAARSGEALSGAPQDRLAMVRPAAASSENQIGPWAMLLISLFGAALFFSIMRTWLLG